MRIGLIQYRSPGQISGGLIYNQKLVDYCRSQGDDVEVIALEWQGWPRAIAANWSPGLRARLKAGHHDLLIEDGFASLSLFALNGSLRNTRRVALVHQLNSKEALPSPAVAVMRFMDYWFLRSVDAILLNSEATLAQVRRLLPRQPPAAVVHPAGDRFPSLLTIDDITDRARAEGPLRVLYAGNVIPRKRLDVLIRTLQSRVTSPWCLTVVGDESPDPLYAARVRELVAGEGPARVRFEGVVEPEHLAGLYRESHVVAVPSRYEGFGMAYLEAMGFGLPPLAAAHGGAGEFVSAGVNGFLIGDNAEEEIAAAIDTLGSGRERLAEMSVAARATFDARPSWAESMGRARSFLLGLVP